MLNISSNEIVLNVMLDRSPNSSSAEVGIAIPPKSVRCVVEQYKSPSGAPGGGGAGAIPSVLQAPSATSQ
eukprot:5007992-Prymnesium_polylepis.3